MNSSARNARETSAATPKSAATNFGIGERPYAGGGTLPDGCWSCAHYGDHGGRGGGTPPWPVCRFQLAFPGCKRWTLAVDAPWRFDFNWRKTAKKLAAADTSGRRSLSRRQAHPLDAAAGGSAMIWRAIRDHRIPLSGFVIVWPTEFDVPEVWACETYHEAERRGPSPGWIHLVESAAMITHWCPLPPFPVAPREDVTHPPKA